MVSTKEKVKGETVQHLGTFRFATGEATNHHHEIHVKNPEDMLLTKMPDGSYMVELREVGWITHHEHSMKGDLIVQPGRYKMYQRREMDWFSLAVRKVID